MVKKSTQENSGLVGDYRSTQPKKDIPASSVRACLNNHGTSKYENWGPEKYIAKVDAGTPKNICKKTLLQPCKDGFVRIVNEFADFFAHVKGRSATKVNQTGGEFRGKITTTIISPNFNYFEAGFGKEAL